MLQSIGEVLKALATVIAALALYLAYRQLRANIRWNRVNACFTFLPEAVFTEKELEASTALNAIGVDLYQQEDPLTKDQVTRILTDSKILMPTKTFLNIFEDYATAYHANAIDRDLSYVLCASRFIKYFNVFWPFIKKGREDWRNEVYWEQFQELVEEWQVRQNHEIQTAAQTRRDIRKPKKYS